MALVTDRDKAIGIHCIQNRKTGASVPAEEHLKAPLAARFADLVPISEVG
jgi:hypothetical protein